MAAHRKQTLQGMAPLEEDEPSSGVRNPSSSSPPSGVRLLVPRGVPRPVSTRPPRIVPPRLAEREAPLLRHDPSLDEAPTEVDFPPPPQPPPSERARVRGRTRREPAAVKIPALPAVVQPIRQPRDVIPPPPGSVPVPSLIMTSQNWPIVRAPVPESPRFGIAYSEELRSLPAFVVPLALRRAARSVAMMAPESHADSSREEMGVAAVIAGNDARSSDPLGDLAWIHGELTQSRRRSALIVVGAVVFLLVTVLLVALLR